MSQIHINKFWSCFPNPPAQPAVGDFPQNYLAKLNFICGYQLIWPSNHPTGKLTRIQLRALCRDANVDVLVAYAAVMAWGGRGVESRNYRLSLSYESRPHLISILTQLRASKQNRQDDFADMQKAATSIKGLGISFYTKLLFFFREDSDAYILDQFTAKSALLLFDNCRVILNSSGYPNTDNTPKSYEWFCKTAEEIGRGRGWTGEQIEQAMFDVRSGEWRRYLLSIYGKAGAKKSNKNNVSHHSKITPSAPPLAERRFVEGAAPAPEAWDNLPSCVASVHAAAYQAGNGLPGANPQVNPPRRGQPIRLHCSLIDGVFWQYAFQQKSIHAELFIPTQHIARYDALCTFLGVADHNFGDGINGNGFKGGITRSIKLTINRGLNAPKNEWDEIAQNAVGAMVTLFDRVSEII
jgi:hypothetical protein